MSDDTPTVPTEDSVNGGMAEASQTPDSAGPNMNTSLPPKPLSMRRKKAMDKQRERLGKLIVIMRRKQMQDQARLNRSLKELKKKIGTDDFEAIKAMVTTFHPEKKDEKGNVVQQAYNSVNYQALLVESKNFLVLRRERRMRDIVGEDGVTTPRTRRRTTGRSSDRKAHKSRYLYIIERGKKAVENKEEISTLKV